MFIALVASVGVINLLLTVVCCRTRSSCGMRCLDALSTVLMCTGPFAHVIIECTATLFVVAQWWWRSTCEIDRLYSPAEHARLVAVGALNNDDISRSAGMTASRTYREDAEAWFVEAKWKYGPMMCTKKVFDISHGRFFIDGWIAAWMTWVCASTDDDNGFLPEDWGATSRLILVVVQLLVAVAAWSGNLYYCYQMVLRRNPTNEFVLSSGWRVLLLAMLARDACVVTLAVLIGSQSRPLFFVILAGAVLRNVAIALLLTSMDIAGGQKVRTTLCGAIGIVVMMQLQFVAVSFSLLFLGRMLPNKDMLLPPFVSCRRTHMLRAFLRVPETLQSAVERAREIKARESFMRQRLLTMAVVHHEEPRRAPNRRTTARGTPPRNAGTILLFVLMGLTLLSETIVCYWFVPNGSTYYHGVCVILTHIASCRGRSVAASSR